MQTTLRYPIKQAYHFQHCTIRYSHLYGGFNLYRTIYSFVWLYVSLCCITCKCVHVRNWCCYADQESLEKLWTVDAHFVISDAASYSNFWATNQRFPMLSPTLRSSCTKLELIIRTSRVISVIFTWIKVPFSISPVSSPFRDVLHFSHLFLCKRFC